MRSRIAVGAAIMAGGGVAVACVASGWSRGVPIASGPTCTLTPSRVESDLRNIITVAEAIYADTGRYPQSMKALVRDEHEDLTPAIAALEDYPRDPWGRDYHYEIAPDGRPRATCLGSDGRPGGEGEAADTVRGGSP